MNDSTKLSSKNYDYRSTISRRDSLKWLGALSASVMLPSIAVSHEISNSGKASKGHWPELKLSSINAKGYGKDPNMIMPPSSPWPKTLTATQLTLVAVVSDIIVPREGDIPSASEVNVPDVIDEWISAPYSDQQRDRVTILSVFVWIDDESDLRFNKPFVKLTQNQKFEIMDDIAYRKEDLAEEFKQVADAFARLRDLVLAAFFCSPQGTKDLGYQGNVAIAGDYPGPTKEAMAHLNKKIAELGLSL